MGSCSNNCALGWWARLTWPACSSCKPKIWGYVFFWMSWFFSSDSISLGSGAGKHSHLVCLVCDSLQPKAASSEWWVACYHFLLIHLLGMLLFWETPLVIIFLCKSGLQAKEPVMWWIREVKIVAKSLSLMRKKKIILKTFSFKLSKVRLLTSSDKLRMTCKFTQLNGCRWKNFLDFLHCHRHFINRIKSEAACYMFAPSS